MKGLLYKEYLVLRGRNILTGLGIVIFSFLLFRIAFPGADEPAYEPGDTFASVPAGVMYDALLLGMVCILPFCCIGLLMPAVKLITESGRKRKERAYGMALPLPADSAVKAKYIIFALLAGAFFLGSYAVFGMYFLGAGQNQASKNAETLLKMFPILMAAVMICGAVDMFAYLGLGKRKGDALILFLLLPFALALVWCFFFVDPDEFSKINFGLFLRFYDRYKALWWFLEILLIAVSVGLYYLSFRIVRRMELKRKAEFDD